MLTVLTSSSSRLSHFDPIRGAIARAAKLSLIHERFQQYNFIAVPLSPILCQAFARQPQYMRGQVAHSHIRQNQKPTIVDHPT
jgi:hypothetical protein